MTTKQESRPKQVIGPLGEPLTLGDLPSPQHQALGGAAQGRGGRGGQWRPADDRRSARALQPHPRGVRQLAARGSTAQACMACASRRSSITASSTNASSATEAPRRPSRPGPSFIEDRNETQGPLHPGRRRNRTRGQRAYAVWRRRRHLISNIMESTSSGKLMEKRWRDLLRNTLAMLALGSRRSLGGRDAECRTCTNKPPPSPPAPA